MTKVDIRKADQELKARTIQVRMSDTDLQALAIKCGTSGISLQDLFEIFVGDLVGGTFYSGSDEGDLADRWFDRHGFAWLHDDSLLAHILKGEEVSSLDDFVTAWEEKTYFELHPEELSSEEDLWWKDELAYWLEDFSRPVTDDDVEQIKQWLHSYRLVGATDV